MKKTLCLLLAALLTTALAQIPAQACTTMIVTKGASADGSMIVAHSDDDELGDQRVIFVPAMDHKPGAERPVYREGFAYPRLVAKDRGPGYDTPGRAQSEILGYIPQVRHTYAYFDGNYGIMNERQLLIGECTDGAKYEPKARPRAGDNEPRRMFYSTQLSRVALERCEKAADAVRLMGRLIDEYGYYGTGETLLVADVDEAWVLEMCALPDETHHSAWVAKRVPDGEFFVAANEFRIREINKDDPDTLYSKHLFPGLKKVGWWGPKKGAPDWLRAVSNGEYNHPYYSLRRVWRVMDRVNPDLALNPWVEDGFTTAYPFSITPAKKIEVAEVFALYRDHYEGTPFDLTRGASAGPYGEPNRFAGPYEGGQNDVSDKKPAGAWERPISVYYQGYTYVCQARGWLPDAIGGLAWFGVDVSYTTCFVPFYAGVNDLPRAWQIGDPQKFSREPAFWAFNLVNNWARLSFRRMTRNDILPRQAEIEAAEAAKTPEIEAAAMALYKKDPAQARAFLTRFCARNADQVLRTWWDLADELIAKYSDGYVNLPGKAARDVGYPAWWLKSAGYMDGPTGYGMR
ncbi:MAG: C69 family dipeptidase [Desulfovibrionaceae bacterium]|nr:C69 family dipeptidase [Desulfovibrionaceae bacterium]